MSIATLFPIVARQVLIEAGHPDWSVTEPGMNSVGDYWTSIILPNNSYNSISWTSYTERLQNTEAKRIAFIREMVNNVIRALEPVQEQLPFAVEEEPVFDVDFGE